MSPLAKQCRTKAEAEGLAGLMNDTKWREICVAFSGLSSPPAFRACDLLTGYISDWDTEWFHHVGPHYCVIEWLEIEPRGCPTSSVREVLQRVGAPFIEDARFRVFGYKR